MRRFIVPVVTLALLLSAGCGDGRPAAKPTGSAAAAAPVPSDADPATRAAAEIARFADEDLVGQVLMPYAYGNDADKVSNGSAQGNKKYAGVSTPAEMVRKYKLGGIILVGWTADDPTASTNKTTNVDSPAQVRTLTGGLHTAARQNAGGAPLLIGIDQEYGQVVRISSGMVQLPSALALGGAAQPALTEAAWQAAGAELVALGINVNFAPVADVLGAGSYIGSRAFGSDPTAVSAQVAAAAKGMQAAGVAATLKHFPGHGHTGTNSHNNLPILQQDRATLDREDLPPFKAGIAAGASMIMTGHLDVRSIDPDTPATFSSKVLVDLLRGQLKFGGVVVSDAMNMAPARRWPPGDAAVRAILAGNDLLLMPPDLTAAHKGLLDGLRAGRLPRARLVEAATRVLTLRYKLAAHKTPDPSVVDGSAGKDAARAVAAAAVTVLRGPCSGALVRGPVSIASADKWSRQRGWLEAALRAHGVQVGTGGGVVRLIGAGETASGAAAVTVAMDTPTSIRGASGTLVATYSSSEASMLGLAAVLAGKAKASGKSPIAVTGLPRSACVR